jgi:hypothetical protein
MTIALKEALQACVRSLSNQPRAVIIDDEVTSRDEKDLADWIALKETLQCNVSLYAKICERMLALSLSVDAPPTSEEWRTIEEGLGIDDRNVKLAIDKYEKQKHVLETLACFLGEVGFDLTFLSARPTLSALHNADLYLVDYQIDPEDHAGDTAVGLIGDVMKAADSAVRSPPMVVLMSKALKSDDVDKWDAVAVRSGYFRFNYDFLNKNDFKLDPALFSLLLLNLLQHRRVADCYYKQIRCLRKEATIIADRVMNDLFQVTPPEAQVFKTRREREGKTLGEEFTNLFIEHFALGLEKSMPVQERMKEMESVVADHGVLPPSSPHRHALHKLYAKLLHADQPASASAFPEFGDIYEDADRKYVLVLTQECDLARRGNGEARVDRVLGIEGMLKDSDVTSEDSTSIISKPILACGDDTLRWLWWDLRKPVVVPYEAVCRPPFKKVWRLRFPEAEDIQQQYSASLTKIGLDLVPEFVVQHQCRLFSARRNAFLPSSVVLYEIVQEKRTLLALSPSDSRALFFNMQHPFLSVERLVEIGVFCPKADFLQKLKQEKIFVCTDPDGLMLLKTTNGSVELPQGVALWQPKGEEAEANP